MSRISIIVPVYNMELYLEQCLDSLINQTFRDIEIICINDGSHDGSIDILNKYAKQDERVSIINKKNGGLSDSRNVGIKKATGKYIMFVDSDDWIDIDTCKNAYDIAEKNKSQIVMWSYVREFGNKTKSKKIFSTSKENYKDREVNMLRRRLFGLTNEELANPENADSLVTAWGKLYLREIIALNNIEFIDTKIIGTEDALFNIEVFGYVNKVSYIDEYFYHYRKVNKDSLTTSYNKNLYIRWQTLYDYMQKIIESENLDQEYKSALNNRIALSIIGIGLNEIRCKDKKICQKAKFISNVLENERYIKAYDNLELKYFKLHWKIFFTLCRYRCPKILTLLLYAINTIIYS